MSEQKTTACRTHFFAVRGFVPTSGLRGFPPVSAVAAVPVVPAGGVAPVAGAAVPFTPDAGVAVLGRVLLFIIITRVLQNLRPLRKQNGETSCGFATSGWTQRGETDSKSDDIYTGKYARETSIDCVLNST